MRFYRNKTFNYKNTVYNINSNDTKTYGTCIVSCNFTNSEYLHHHHRQILTGYLQIIQDKKLCKMRSIGPNYREPKIIIWKKGNKASWKT